MDAGACEGQGPSWDAYELSDISRRNINVPRPFNIALAFKLAIDDFWDILELPEM